MAADRTLSSAPASAPESEEVRDWSAPESEEVRDWTELPDDLLRVIFKLLPVDLDAVRFRSVCSSWLSAVPHRRLSPWLLGHCNSREGEHNLFSFFSLSGDRILPEIRPGMAFCGSSHGWMALLSEDLQISLYNPVSRSLIPLPEIPDFRDFFPVIGIHRYDEDVMHYHIPTVFASNHFEDLMWDVVMKVVLSSDPIVAAEDCTVVLLGWGGSSLAFCRIGDDAWTLASIPMVTMLSCFFCPYTDALFYKGQLYISFLYNLFRCSLGANPEVVEISITNDPIPAENIIFTDTFLIELCGDLLLVAIYDEIHVFNLEFDESGGTVRLQSMESVGDRAVFLSQSHSFSVPASKFPGYKENCVYVIHSHNHEIGNMIKVYDLATGHEEVIPYCLPGSSSLWRPCAWFTPRIL